jgi:hypothetical protein
VGGGSQSSSGQNQYSSNNTSTGISGSQSAPQLSPQQLLSLYSSAIPQINNTATQTATANNSSLVAANSGATQGVNAINLNGLSPGEYNATERSLNQSNASTGNLGINNGTNTVRNATDFGGAFNSKIPLLNTATTTATGTANANTNATGGAASVVNPIASNASSPISTSSSIFGSQGISSGSGANGSSGYNVSLCCFIFLEAYYGNIPWYVRKCRDKYYKLFPEIASGYTWMARWLVPMMQRYQCARLLVWLLMVKPLTYHGASVVCNKAKWQYKLTRKFWFSLWNIIGKVKGYGF